MGSWGPRVNMIFSKRYRWFSDDKSHGTVELGTRIDFEQIQHFVQPKNPVDLVLGNFNEALDYWFGLFESKLAFVRAF